MNISQREWDSYWEQQSSVTKTYGKIASIYRKFIIPRSLIKTLNLKLNSNSRILHAGAGGGEVDVALAPSWNLYSIDYSFRATIQHREVHYKDGREDLVAQADIFNLPFANNTFDAVFNLGVMEHFSDDEIVDALKEFRRVTRVGGVIILYWPPIWGLSVMVLRSAKFLLQLERRKQISLYPPEINLVKSRRRCERWISEADLSLEQFSFGIGDFFTHQIVIARKTK